MTRRKRQEDGKKHTERVAPRFSKAEKALLNAAALKKRLTLSHFIGEIVLDKAEEIMGMSLEEFERIHMPKK